MRNRRSDIFILLFSLFLAAGMWLVHILSQTYYAYLPFNIKVESTIEGYAPQSVSSQTLFLGGKASGFYILSYNLSGKEPVDAVVTVSEKLFSRSEENPDLFSVRSSLISDRISENVNQFIEVTYIPDVVLDFTFEPQTYRKIPVISSITAECLPQYMLIEDVRLEPDSVIVYGNESDLASITEVKTKSLSISEMDRSTSGMVALEKIEGVRIDHESVAYSFQVSRYIEHTYTVNLSTINVPAGKKLILLPSQVEVSCRIPFGSNLSDFENDAIFAVDYNDVVASRSGKVSPIMDDTGCVAYSVAINPPFVECIISEEVQ